MITDNIKREIDKLYGQEERSLYSLNLYKVWLAVDIVMYIYIALCWGVTAIELFTKGTINTAYIATQTALFSPVFVALIYIEYKKIRGDYRRCRCGSYKFVKTVRDDGYISYVYFKCKKCHEHSLQAVTKR